MKRIDFLRYATAVSLALMVHLLTYYGIAKATPWPRQCAVIHVGPVVAVGMITATRIASRTTRAPEG